ncbi:Transcription initiation factor IIE subunit alpha [Astathelohania contejeani]|uniref:Transcription initiation factor IIE subunit alpha n=1 Tax=Astathelohania contejeani TaxID=164912 RepID=A0ABQ7HZN9_9MICR|nr:Transcription initiation factor IIE subunit alpha [Thelohania contejeani]
MEYENIIKRMVKLIMRMFYEPHHAIILDILLDKIILYDYELCDRMKMLGKEFNRIVSRLKEDNLIKHETKIETQLDGRQLHRMVYYIDYCEIRDIIKYKFYKISKILETEIKNSEQLQGYACNVCGKEFEILDAQKLIVDFLFLCDDCGSELVENMRKCEIENPHQVYTGMMESFREIIGLLKEADGYEIPSLDYFQALNLRKTRESQVVAEPVREKQEEPIKIKDESISFDIVGETNKEDKKETIPNDVKVKVNGIEKLFNEITEEDKEMMNEEEYEAYYELYNEIYKDK